MKLYAKILLFPFFMLCMAVFGQIIGQKSEQGGKAIKKEYLRVATPKIITTTKLVYNRTFLIDTEHIKLTRYEFYTLMALFTSAFTFIIYKLWTILQVKF